MSLENLVSNIEKKPFGLNDIVNKIPKAQGILYSELGNSLPKFEKTLVILLDPPNKLGHFVGLIKKSDFEMIFFDPYGKGLDFLTKILDLPPTLKNLLKNYRLEENHHQFEVLSPKINTCGMWVILRLRLSNLSNQKFRKVMRYKTLPSDSLAVLLNLMNFNMI